jgi:hypothetical protein
MQGALPEALASFQFRYRCHLCVTKKRSMGPGATLGRSQNTRSSDTQRRVNGLRGGKMGWKSRNLSHF